MRSIPPVSQQPGSVPRHIAIIMDGNGRWARGKGLERLNGHERGAEAVRDCVKGCRELGVKLLACEAGMRVAGLDAGRLISGVEVAGVPHFLAEVGRGQIVTL